MSKEFDEFIKHMVEKMQADMSKQIELQLLYGDIGIEMHKKNKQFEDEIKCIISAEE